MRTGRRSNTVEIKWSNLRPLFQHPTLTPHQMSTLISRQKIQNRLDFSFEPLSVSFNHEQRHRFDVDWPLKRQFRVCYGHVLNQTRGESLV